MITETEAREFQEVVWNYYHQHGRDLPWREPEADGQFSPYKILVSELMLQQTQVNRVIPKYNEFLHSFPDIARLDQAGQGDVLRAWSGLGYNRRARFLHQTAQQITRELAAKFPDQKAELVKLSGIGVNTAGAILAYAFNQPVAFVETNVRTVYLHHFFQDAENISDAEILDLVSATIDHEHPRQWYWALMDYGSFLKQTIGNQNHRSKSYAKQSKFEGSFRQVRGEVLRQLGVGAMTADELASAIQDERLTEVIAALVAEGLVTRRGQRLSL